MMATYLTSDELTRYSKVTDPELNELFQEVRGNTYFIQETTYPAKRSFWDKLFRRPIKPGVVRYQLYILIEPNFKNFMLQHSSIYEVQVFNFPADSEWSINPSAPRVIIYTFLLGLVNGMARKSIELNAQARKI